MFKFQQLDVYRCAIQFLEISGKLADQLPRGQADLLDQLMRASRSIVQNIAEGAGKFGKDEKRFYTIARGSATECAAILDCLQALRFASEKELKAPRELLKRIVEMLTKMILR